MADIKQIKVGDTTYNIEPYTDYLPLAGGRMSGDIKMTENSTSIIFRSASADWYSGIYANSTGDELLGIVVSNPRTHIMLGNADVSERPACTALTPAIDIKNGKVGINKRLGTDGSADAGSYNLDVNGSINASGTIDANSARISNGLYVGSSITHNPSGNLVIGNSDNSQFVEFVEDISGSGWSISVDGEAEFDTICEQGVALPDKYALNSYIKVSSEGEDADCGEEAVAIGGTSVAENYSVAIGSKSFAGDNPDGDGIGPSVAIGWEATAYGGTAIGYSSAIDESVAISGSAAKSAQAWYGGVAIGTESNAGEHGVAVGYSAWSDAGISIGDAANSGETGIAIGSNATITEGESGMSIGNGASAESGISIGASSSTVGDAIAIGGNTSALRTDYIAIGNGIKLEASTGTGSYGTVAIGNDIKANTSSHSNVWIGDFLYTGTCTAARSVHIGAFRPQIHSDAVTIGYNAYSYTGSVSVGIQATSNGFYQVAIGSYAYSSGTGAVCIGYQAKSSGAGFAGGPSASAGSSAVAIGYQAYSNSNSVAVGYQTVATGQYSYSVAVGYQAKSFGNTYGAVALGFGATSTGCGAVAIGTHAKAYNTGTNSGYGSIAIGCYSTATGPYGCVAIGPSGRAYYASTAVGRSAYAYGGYSVAIGYNAKAGVSTATGTSAVASGAYCIAIGASVSASTSGSKGLIKIGSTNNYYFCNGGSWQTGSDIRDKINIQPFYGALPLIKNIQPITFQYNFRTAYSDSGSLLDYDEEEYKNATKASDELCVGFSAQEVANFFDKHYGDEKFNGVIDHNIEVDADTGETKDAYTLGDTRFIPFLFQAIKEQQEIIESLTERVEELEKIVKGS